MECALVEVATLWDEMFELGTVWERRERMWGFGVLAEVTEPPAID